MKLKEFEGKQLLSSCQIPTSSGIIIKKNDGLDTIDFSKAKLAKVQTLQGERKKKGGIKLINSKEEAKQFVDQFLGLEFNKEIVNEILLDEKIEIQKELYLGILFDSSIKAPILLASKYGGINIESNLNLVKIPIDYTLGITEKILEKIHNTFEGIESLNFSDLDLVVKNLYQCFIEYDLRMVEINPLVLDNTNQLIAVDAVAVLDDDAKYRWSKKINFPERTGSRKATEREIAAKKIDEDDHRGVAGKTFLDLDGDIAILTSGGGASMTLVDTLISLGGKPANFTEYSGNPPREKVEKLTRIVLDKEGLSGLLIGGVIANFTNIKETLQGVVDVLIEKKPDYPIVIRRAGPNDLEAKKMLLEVKEKYGLDIHYYGEELVLSKAAEIIKKLSDEYKQKKNITVEDKEIKFKGDSNEYSS